MRRSLGEIQGNSFFGLAPIFHACRTLARPARYIEYLVIGAEFLTVQMSFLARHPILDWIGIPAAQTH